MATQTELIPVTCPECQATNDQYIDFLIGSGKVPQNECVCDSCETVLLVGAVMYVEAIKKKPTNDQ